MQYKANEGEVTLTLQTSKKQAILDNGCKTVGQGSGVTDAEIAETTLTDLYHRLHKNGDGQFKYFQPLKVAYLSLAQNICTQVGIEPIVFVKEDED